MKILINATALDKRGAYSLVKAFVVEMNAVSDYLKAQNIELHFLISRIELRQFENEQVKIIFEPITKKSFFHKWKYEKFILPGIVNKEQYDVYLSLQNYVLKNIKVKQFSLIHQPIPFSNLKFSELEFSNWLKYKIIYNRILKKQKDFINGVIVQTQWMKEAVINRYGYTCPVKIIRPEVDNIENNNAPLSEGVLKQISNSSIKLFYPTGGEKYKNNLRLIKAIEEYNKVSDKKVTLFITLEGKSNDFIKFTGKIPYESIYNFYCQMDALIFPSLTETMGFPLLEAQQCSLPIITSDLPYAREICGDGAYYFEPRDLHSIVDSIKTFVNDEHKKKSTTVNSSNDGYIDYIRFVNNFISKTS